MTLYDIVCAREIKIYKTRFLFQNKPIITSLLFPLLFSQAFRDGFKRRIFTRGRFFLISDLVSSLYRSLRVSVFFFHHHHHYRLISTDHNY